MYSRMPNHLSVVELAVMVMRSPPLPGEPTTENESLVPSAFVTVPDEAFG